MRPASFGSSLGAMSLNHFQVSALFPMPPMATKLKMRVSAGRCLFVVTPSVGWIHSGRTPDHVLGLEQRIGMGDVGLGWFGDDVGWVEVGDCRRFVGFCTRSFELA